MPSSTPVKYPKLAIHSSKYDAAHFGSCIFDSTIANRSALDASPCSRLFYTCQPSNSTVSQELTYGLEIIPHLFFGPITRVVKALRFVGVMQFREDHRTQLVDGRIVTNGKPALELVSIVAQGVSE